MFFGLRVTEEEETDGVDISECGLEAYPEFSKASGAKLQFILSNKVISQKSVAYKVTLLAVINDQVPVGYNGIGNSWI